ncbi:hypothetical protein BN85411240 [Alteracholeplasma palmae J233]|uniref:Uncharacterized protein n=1 Tax=Alteracholeplasma palmae (strain ATCC 49389 / J233) TaxID=1318466 RepID=U4KS41_ALTPJ|nr:hypothetical protein [Alteracholeplasma palmae]CCV64701.1 hypothetical protein BN85411240 [Alteracholeplasma palmae J233]
MRGIIIAKPNKDGVPVIAIFSTEDFNLYRLNSMLDTGEISIDITYTNNQPISILDEGEFEIEHDFPNVYKHQPENIYLKGNITYLRSWTLEDFINSYQKYFTKTTYVIHNHDRVIYPNQIDSVKSSLFLNFVDKFLFDPQNNGYFSFSGLFYQRFKIAGLDRYRIFKEGPKLVVVSLSSNSYENKEMGIVPHYYKFIAEILN